MAQTLNLSSLDFKKCVQENDVLCVYGLDDGSIYKDLSEWLKKENHYLIFIEDDEHLFLKTKQGLLAQDPKVRLFFYQYENDQAIFSQIAWEFLFLKMAYVSVIEEKGKFFFKQLDDFRHAVTLLASDWRDMGQKVLSNMIRNVRFFSSSVLGSSLKDSCRGMPALICAAGTSLNKIIPLLPQLKDRALIVAGGTAISALNAHGVIPHLAAYIDPEPPRERFLGQNSFETPFLYQSRFSSELLSYVHGQRIWIPGTGNYPIEEWLSSSIGIEATQCDTGWTVASFCVFTAAFLGCDPLILCGMDFSCSPESIYASGLRGEENRDKLIAIKDEKGRELHSKPDWLMTAEWISSCAASHPLRKWINASEGIELTGIEKKDCAQVAATVLNQSYDMDAHLYSCLSRSTRLVLDEINNQFVIQKMGLSFEKCLAYCQALLGLWEKTFPQSPMNETEYAMIELDLETEICHQYFLQPLWDMWKTSILRNETHPFGKHLHRLLFFKNSIETNRGIFFS